jgi:hypothetical protein
MRAALSSFLGFCSVDGLFGRHTIAMYKPGMAACSAFDSPTAFANRRVIGEILCLTRWADEYHDLDIHSFRRISRLQKALWLDHFQEL